MSCIFCENANIKSRAVAENRLAFAFLTNIPIVPGHVLIAPVRCVRTWSELSADEKEELEALRQKIVKVLTKSFGATGFNFAWNEGESSGQSVPHLHLHILPRKAGDTGITKYEPRKFLYRPGSRAETPEAELKEVTAIIRASF